MQDEASTPVVFQGKRRLLAPSDVLLELRPAGLWTPIEGLIEWADIDLLGVDRDKNRIGVQLLDDGWGGDEQPTEAKIDAWQTSRTDYGYEVIIRLADAFDVFDNIVAIAVDYALERGFAIKLVDFETLAPQAALEFSDESDADDIWPRLPSSNVNKDADPTNIVP